MNTAELLGIAGFVLAIASLAFNIFQYAMQGSRVTAKAERWVRPDGSSFLWLYLENRRRGPLQLRDVALVREGRGGSAVPLAQPVKVEALIDLDRFQGGALRFELGPDVFPPECRYATLVLGNGTVTQVEIVERTE
jgi:hypothetical protein